jgi:hypothetical protein
MNAPIAGYSRFKGLTPLKCGPALGRRRTTLELELQIDSLPFGRIKIFTGMDRSLVRRCCERRLFRRPNGDAHTQSLTLHSTIIYLSNFTPALLFHWPTGLISLPISYLSITSRLYHLHSLSSLTPKAILPIRRLAVSPETRPPLSALAS